MAGINCTLASVTSVIVAVCVGKILFSVITDKKVVTHKRVCRCELHYNFFLRILFQVYKLSMY
jgi:hypothetical protein